MKFGDKLIALRKKNGYSQEQLAEKLKVSRQSVSKWESNNTYPETDKIVQICNIFECSMDDLINDSIKDISEVERKEKNNINIVFDSLLEFITKSIDMFSKMTFGSGLKCIIELLILAFILWIVGSIGTSIIVSVISKLFNFIPHEGYVVIRGILDGIISIIWFVISVIVILHTYKIRYLNYFEDNKIKTEKSNGEISKSKEKIEIKKQPEVIIRNEKDEPFAFLSVLSKIVIWFIKFIVFWILFGFAVSLICIVGMSIIFIPFAINSMCFAGALIALIGCSVINALVVLLLFNFIFDRKNNLKLMLIVFLGALVFTGIGGGIGTLGFKNIDISTENSIRQKDIYEEIIDYKENMYIDNQITKTKYIIDNSKENNKLEVRTNYNNDYSKIYLGEIDHSYEMIGIGLNQVPKNNIKKFYNEIMKDLKNNKIRNYSYGFSDIEVVGNEETINKLIENLDKIYLSKKEVKENKTIIISDLTNKIVFNYNECDVDYNAANNSLTVNDSSCTCEKVLKETSDGTRVEINCKNNK